jgi:hypothetical protein
VRVRPRDLSPGSVPLSPVLQRDPEVRRSARAAREPRRFRARPRYDPERLPSAWPAILRPRWAPRLRVVKRASEAPGTLSRAADRPPPSDGHGLPPHATPPTSKAAPAHACAFAADAPARGGRCSSPTSATDSLTRALAVRPFEARCARPLSQLGTPVEGKLRRAARVMARLTALHELRKHVLVRSAGLPCRFRGLGACFAGAARSWWGPDRGPLGLRPRARGVFFRVPRESSSSDVLPTTSAHRSAYPPTEAAYPGASSKAPLRPLPDAFHRRMPARPRRLRAGISNAGPPPSRGFATPGPASDAPSLPRPVKGRGLDPAAFENSSLSCARGRASFVDFCQRDDPQARPSDDRHPASGATT